MIASAIECTRLLNLNSIRRLLHQQIFSLTAPNIVQDITKLYHATEFVRQIYENSLW